MLEPDIKSTKHATEREPSPTGKKKLRSDVRGTSTIGPNMPPHAQRLNMEAIQEQSSDEKTSKRSSDETAGRTSQLQGIAKSIKSRSSKRSESGNCNEVSSESEELKDQER